MQRCEMAKEKMVGKEKYRHIINKNYRKMQPYMQCLEQVLPKQGSQEMFNTMVIWRIFPTKEKHMGNICVIFFFKWEILENTRSFRYSHILTNNRRNT